MAKKELIEIFIKKVEARKDLEKKKRDLQMKKSYVGPEESLKDEDLQNLITEEDTVIAVLTQEVSDLEKG